MRNKSEEYGVCVDTRKREDGCFHQVTLFSFLSPPQDLKIFPFWFWKRDFFLVLFLPAVLFIVVVRRRHFRAFLVGRPSPKKSTRFVVLSVSSHAPLESCLREHLLTVESARTGT